jgi:hypothetical protein
MEEKGLPTSFFVYPEDKFSNDVVLLNLENGAIRANEERVRYKEEFLPVWGVDLESLKTLWRNRVSIPGFKFRVYAKINDRIQSWKLLDAHKKARVAKTRKTLHQLGQKKMAAKQQPPLE